MAKHVTKKEFDELKALLDKGVKAADLVKLKITKRAEPTLSRINTSDSFEDYRERVREANEKYYKKEKKEAQTNSNGVKKTHVTTQDKDTAIVALLTEINKNLKKLVDIDQEIAEKVQTKRRWL